MTVYTANVLFGIPESALQVRKTLKRRTKALTVPKIYKVYGETYWKFRYVWDRLSRAVGDRGEEPHARHARVIVVDG